MSVSILILAGVLVGLARRTTATRPEPEAVRAAVEKALPLILKSTGEYPESRDCFSCHHQAVPVLALATAKGRGFAVPAEAIGGPVEHTEADLRGALEGYRKGVGQGGGVTRAGYALLTLEVGGKTPDEVTDAVAEYLLKEGRVPRPLAGLVEPPAVGGERVHLDLPRPPRPGGLRQGRRRRTGSPPAWRRRGDGWRRPGRRTPRTGSSACSR